MKKLILIATLALSANFAFSQTKPKTTDTAKSQSVTRTTSFRMRYDQVFKRNTDGSFSALQPVQINGETVGSGLAFTRGTTFGGVDIATYEGHDLLVDTLKGVVIIRKVF
jgi:ABC-type glycerol-3-phosphate transport system substrate-binding protein